MVLEVMGRHAGWIALHAGIAGGGDVILIPEIPWTFDNVCHKILDREVHGKHFTLVVVAEGAHLPTGEMVGEERRGAQKKLGGIGPLIARELEERLHREARTVVLGHLQRGGSPSARDRHGVSGRGQSEPAPEVCAREPEPPVAGQLLWLRPAIHGRIGPKQFLGDSIQCSDGQR